MRRLLDYNQFSGVATYHEYDSLNDTTTLTYEQSAEAIESVLEINKALANEEDYSRQGIKNEWWHYGTIPDGLILKWLKEENLNLFTEKDTGRILAKLNDPDYKYLKATSGRHVARK